MQTAQLAVTGVNWNVDQAGIVGLTFGLNALNVCCSDGVQPFAIVACEAIGTTLWMCTKTRLKMHELAKRRTWSKPFGDRIGLAIGFAPQDVAAILSQSAAGGNFLTRPLHKSKWLTLIWNEQFLGLAAALVSLNSNFEAAKMLECLLRGQVRKGLMQAEVIPNISSLKGLLEAIEHKICTSSFSDIVMGWNMIFRSEQSFGMKYLSGDQSEALKPSVPTPDVFRLVLEALSTIYRLGEAQFCVMCVPGLLASWIVAYIQWSTGEAPSVRKCGDLSNTSILLQQNPKVLVEISDCSEVEIEIKTFKAVSDLEHVLSRERISFHDPLPCKGVVGVQKYFEDRLSSLSSSNTTHNISNALLMLAVVFGDRFRSASSDLPKLLPNPFGGTKHILSVMKRILGSHDTATRLEALEMYRSDKFTPLRDDWHIKDPSLAEKTAHLFFEILLLSTVDDVLAEDGLLFHVQDLRRKYTIARYFITILQEALKGGLVVDGLQSSPMTMAVIFPQMESEVLLACVLEFVTGIPEPDAGKSDYVSNTLIRSRNGYVVYPQILETLIMNCELPIQFRILPGKLEYEGSQFPYVECAHHSNMTSESIKKLSNWSKQHGTAAQWAVSVHENCLSMYWIPYSNTAITVSPRDMLKACFRMISLGSSKGDCSSSHSQTIHEDSSCRDAFHCGSLVDALDVSLEHPVRIISCSEDQRNQVFAHCALRSLNDIPKALNGNDGIELFIAQKHLGCSRCAIRTALEYKEQLLLYKASRKTGKGTCVMVIVD